MTASDSLKRDLAYQIANIFMSHRHLMANVEQNNAAGIAAYVNDQFADMKLRCRNLSLLLSQTAASDPQLHRTFVQPGVRGFVDYNLFLTLLTNVSEWPANEKNVENVKYKSFVRSLATIGNALPADAFSMFDKETVDWLRSGFTSLLEMLKE